MVVVRVELWPKGIEANKVCLNEVRISNTGAGTVARGIYACRFFGRAGRRLARRDVLHFGFARRSSPALTLVRRVLEQAGF